MSNIWSSNKYVNIVVNILLFLLGINIFHYGQLLLPIICLILFVDRKFKFRVNNIKIFVVLCLFAISYFAFSYEQGFYSVMGFCLPMAYYIGSNILTNDKEKIVRIVYLISFGMIVHVLLNFMVDIRTNGWHLFGSSSHYDVWVSGKMSSTATAINYLPLIGFLYYLIVYEKDKVKRIFILCFIVIMVYSIALAQRTTYLLIIISFIVSVLTDFYLNKSRFNKKIVITILFIISGVIIGLVLSFLLIDKFHDWIVTTRLFYKVLMQGLHSNRIEIFFNTLNLIPYHLWGGYEISETLGIMPHDLWLDVYDGSGIITMLVLLTHSLLFAKEFIIFIKNKEIDNKYKIFFIPLFICVCAQCLLEPIMSGASLFLIVVIIFEALIEKLNYGK